MKKKLAMILTVCMTLSMTMGCNVFGAETPKDENNAKVEQQSPEKREPQQKGDMAKIVEVNENSIVVTLAEKPEKPEGEEGERPPMPEGEEGEMPPEKPEGEEGERPPMPEGEEGEVPPEKPEGEEGERPPMPEGEEGEVPPEKPEGEEGERPPRHGRMMKEITFSEEEIEITLDDSVVIDLGQGTEGSIEDIAVDDVIMIAYEEDGETVKNIFVRREKPENELKDISEND